MSPVFNFKKGCFCNECNCMHIHGRPHIKLKTRHRFFPLSLSLSMSCLLSSICQVTTITSITFALAKKVPYLNSLKHNSLNSWKYCFVYLFSAALYKLLSVHFQRHYDNTCKIIIILLIITDFAYKWFKSWH